MSTKSTNSNREPKVREPKEQLGRELGEVREEVEGVGREVEAVLAKEEVIKQELEEFRQELRVATFSGPIPPPELLERYSTVIPDLPERLVKQFELEATHRREMERFETEHAYKIESLWAQHATSKVSRGQWFGLLIAIIALSVTTYALYLGETSAACVIGGTTVVGLAAVFVTGRVLERRNAKSDDDDRESEFESEE